MTDTETAKQLITTPDGRRWNSYALLTRFEVDMAQFARAVVVPVASTSLAFDTATVAVPSWDVVTTVGYPESDMVVTVEELMA